MNCPRWIPHRLGRSGAAAAHGAGEYGFRFLYSGDELWRLFRFRHGLEPLQSGADTWGHEYGVLIDALDPWSMHFGLERHSGRLTSTVGYIRFVFSSGHVRCWRAVELARLCGGAALPARHSPQLWHPLTAVLPPCGRPVTPHDRTPCVAVAETFSRRRTALTPDCIAGARCVLCAFLTTPATDLILDAAAWPWIALCESPPDAAAAGEGDVDPGHRTTRIHARRCDVEQWLCG